MNANEIKAIKIPVPPLDVQNRIAQAFDDIRTHLAQRQFGKPYGELSDAQRQVVMRAVPLKISEAEPHVSR